MKSWKAPKTSSKGYGIAKAFVVKRDEITLNENRIDSNKKEEEFEKFTKAVEVAVKDLEKLAVDNDIFGAHVMLAQDISLRDNVKNKIENDLQNVEIAVYETCKEFELMFSSIDDDYMKERSADMKDISERFIRILTGKDDNPFVNLKEKSIIVANDLTPSDTSKMDLDMVAGFITEVGGVTSHVCIIAKNLKIPCLVGLGDLSAIKNGDNVILSAKTGDVYLNPTKEQISEYTLLNEKYLKEEEELERLSKLEAITLDGRTFELCANVGTVSEIENAITYQIDGVGLFRSEFLYMENNHFPTEEEQFHAYKQAAILLDGKEIIIRTLDIGGDKELSYYEFPDEENPFLGYRAIRISLDQTNLLKDQLRALLRASDFGNIKIMYPMIVSIEELKKANEILDLCKAELRDNNIAFNENIKVGMMIETPAAVLMAENFAKFVDFFSIGTNDLTQYILAVDRGNVKVSKLYNSFDPAVLKAIKLIIDAGHKENIKVGMCGEFASDEKAAILLLGMGLDEFSMSASEIARIKNKLRNIKYEEVKEFADEILTLSSIEEVLAKI